MTLIIVAIIILIVVARSHQLIKRGVRLSDANINHTSQQGILYYSHFFARKLSSFIIKPHVQFHPSDAVDILRIEYYEKKELEIIPIVATVILYESFYLLLEEFREAFVVIARLIVILDSAYQLSCPDPCSLARIVLGKSIVLHHL
jgi:hypothetical protein